MNDAVDRNIAKVHEQVATRNAIAAVDSVNQLRKETQERLQTMEQLLQTLMIKLGQLEQKYNLLLTKRFNGGSTAE